MNLDLTAERLHELLHYDPETGLFTWRKKKGRRAAGQSAGTAKTQCAGDRGYIYIRIDGARYLAHRLAWLYVHGRWPAEFVDHINRNPGDNRIGNLREATKTLNNGNMGLLSTNTSGCRGVSFNRQAQKWEANIWKQNRQKYLGRFATKEEAAEAYDRAAAEYFGEFAYLNLRDAA